MATEQYRKEVVVTQQPVARITDDLPRPKRKTFAVLYYVLDIIEAVLALRVIFKLLGANPASGFTSLLYSTTAPLVAPFAGIFRTPTVQGSVLEWSTIVAMIIYALVAYAIVQLLRIAWK